MAVFGRKPQYDRRTLLEEAKRAEARGRNKRALACYARVLEVEPHDIELNRKAAPLLAQVGREKEALTSFALLTEGLLRQRLPEEAMSVCREATDFFPRNADLWLTLARLQLQHEKAAAARESLLAGRSHLKRRRDRPSAIRLLEQVMEIDDGDIGVALDLAELQCSCGARARATLVLEPFEGSATGSDLKRLRRVQWRVQRSPRNLLAWLRA